MPFVTRKSLLTLGVLAAVGVAVTAGAVWSGVYNVAADDAHTRPVHSLLETVRERSIQSRASQLQVPDLRDPARITQGAGNYNAMCMGCHLAPGMAETEMSKGLNPAPPNLTKTTVDAAAAFWVTKHGIKASGMPAWGKSMDDEYIWNMVAFIQQLPKLTPAQYQDTVARSGGHSHGGGETTPHDHGAGASDDHHAAPDSDEHHGGDDHHDADGSARPGAARAGGTTHVHADGKQHVHDAPITSKAAPAAKPMPTTKPASAQPATEPKPEARPESEAGDHDAHEHQH